VDLSSVASVARAYLLLLYIGPRAYRRARS